MSNPNLPHTGETDDHADRLEGRRAAIAALGALGFKLEAGPNYEPGAEQPMDTTEPERPSQEQQ